MKTLIAEDDATSRLLLQELLKPYGAADVALTGREAVAAIEASLVSGTPYDLVCLDIMMPEMDGQEALRALRSLEAKHGREGPRAAKVLMTTALRDKGNVLQAFRGQCDGYLVKPIDRAMLVRYLGQFHLVPQT